MSKSIMYNKYYYAATTMQLRRGKGKNNKVSDADAVVITKSSKTIDPTRNLFPCQTKTHIIAKMVTILGNEIVGISRVILS